MRVLITGGAGFIGSHIAEYFNGKAEIRVLDNLRSGYRKNLDGIDAEFIEGDIRDRKTVAEAVRGVDYVQIFANVESEFVKYTLLGSVKSV